MMKKRIFLLVICCALSVYSTTALGAGNNYISAAFLVPILSDADLAEPGAAGEAKFDNGRGIGGAFGHDYGNLRAELEIAYRKNDFDSVTITSPISGSANAGGEIIALSILVNGYYDFENLSDLTPYITGGIGLATLDIEVGASYSGIGGNFLIGDEDDTVFAYQLGAGVGFAITDSMTVDLGYRFFATSDPEFGITEAEYMSHNISLGLRTSF